MVLRISFVGKPETPPLPFSCFSPCPERSSRSGSQHRAGSIEPLWDYSHKRHPHDLSTSHSRMRILFRQAWCEDRSFTIKLSPTVSCTEITRLIYSGDPVDHFISFPAEIGRDILPGEPCRIGTGFNRNEMQIIHLTVSPRDRIEF